MIYLKSFSNYETFCGVFGLRECGNGNKSRMNKILLGCLKDKTFFHYCVRRNQKYLSCNSMADFKRYLLDDLERSGGDAGYECHFRIDGIMRFFRHPDYEIDNGGFCEDGDKNAIRYYNHDREGYFKMKAGKFFTKIMEACPFGRLLPQQAKSWLGEEFLTSWQAYTEANMPSCVMEFHYGNKVEDFETIYSSRKQRGCFHSCMNNEGNHTMYVKSVKAHAAWLTDADGLIFARCVVWDEVFDETTGGTLRLAERQYSDGVQDRFKKMLVDELIKRQLIDGYKQIGADCHDNRNFVLNDGTSIRDHRLSIDCSIHDSDRVSYMDSFVYYDRDFDKAYNYDFDDYTDKLDITEGHLEDCHDGQVWSDYNEEYIDEDDAFYVERHSDWFYDSQVVEDCNGNWQLVDDCVRCDNCGSWVLEEDAYSAEGLDDLYFCDSECAENWAESHGYTWAEYDECYIRVDDAVTVNRYCGYRNGDGYWEPETMSQDDFDYSRAEMHELDGEWYWLETDRAEEAFKNMTLPAVIVAA